MDIGVLMWTFALCFTLWLSGWHYETYLDWSTLTYKKHWVWSTEP